MAAGTPRREEAFKLYDTNRTIPAHLYPAAADRAAAAPGGGAGPQRHHRPGRHPDGLLGGRSRRLGRQPGGHLQHPDDPDHGRPRHRRRGGHQPVHRPPGAQKRQGHRRPDHAGDGRLQLHRRAGGPVRAAPDPARRLRRHRRRRHGLRRDLFPDVGPQLSLHRDVQRGGGPLPGAGQQQDQYAVQPGDERAEHRRQRHLHLRLRHGGVRRGPCHPASARPLPPCSPASSPARRSSSCCSAPIPCCGWTAPGACGPTAS